MTRWIENYDAKIGAPKEVEECIRLSLDAKHYEYATTPNNTAIVWLYNELRLCREALPERLRK